MKMKVENLLIEHRVPVRYLSTPKLSRFSEASWEGTEYLKLLFILLKMVLLAILTILPLFR